MDRSAILADLEPGRSAHALVGTCTFLNLLQKLRLHMAKLSYKGAALMDASVTSILQQLRTLEELVTHHGMTTKELHGLELELRTIVERLDAIRTIARDLKHIPKLTTEDTNGLDELEATLKDSVKKDVD